MSVVGGNKLSKDDWDFVVTAYNNKVINLATLVDWAKLTFDAILPDWIHQELVKVEHFSVWYELRCALSETSCDNEITKGKFGCVVYDRDVVYVNKIYEANVNKEYKGKVINKTKMNLNSKRTGKPVYFEAEDVRTNDDMLACICRKIRHGIGFDSGDKHWLRWAYPITSKILAERTQIDPAEAILMAVRGGKSVITVDEIILIVKKCVGLGGHLLAGFLLAACSHADLKSIILNLCKFQIITRGIKVLTKILKLHHDRCRSIGDIWCPPLGIRNHNSSYEHLMYTYCLIGRHTLDFSEIHDGIQARTKPNRDQVAWSDSRGWSTELFEEYVDEGMNELTDHFVGGKLASAEWKAEEFLAHSFMIGSTGSTNKISKMTATINGNTEQLGRGNKNSFIAGLKVDTFLKAFGLPPMVRGTAVPKYELAKIRLLLPADTWHWLLESVALFGGENSVYRASKAIALNKSAASELSDMLARTCLLSGSQVRGASDFKDFNVLHEMPRMARGWMNLIRKMGFEEFNLPDADNCNLMQLSAVACRWLAAALADVAVSDPLHAGEYVHMIRGLWSGMRSTTWHNTTFNYSYSYAVSKTFKNLHGYEPFLNPRYLGDDSVCEFVDEWTALTYLSLLDRCGLDAVSYKQLVSNTRTEFLRLMYDTRKIRGALCRSLGSLVSSDAQSAPFRSGPERISAMSDTLHLMVRRGANPIFIERNRLPLCRYVGHAVIHLEGMKKATFDPPDVLLKASTSSGGFGVGAYGVIPPDAVPVLPTRELSNGMNMSQVKESVGGLNLPNVRTATKMFISRVHGTGLKSRIDSDELISDLSKGPLEPLFPYSATEAIRQAQAMLDVEWFKSIKSDKLIKLIPRKRRIEIDLVVLNCLDTLRNRVENGYKLPPVINVQDSADLVLAVAADTVAPASHVIGKLGSGALRTTEAAIELGSHKVLKTITSIQSVIGISNTEKALRGTLKLNASTGGVLPQAHTYLLHHCFQVAMDELSRSTGVLWITTEVVKTCFVDVANSLAALLPHHLWWGSTIAY